MIVEFMNTGAAVTYQAISIFSLYSYLGSFGIVVLVFQIIFVIFVIYFLVSIIKYEVISTIQFNKLIDC